MNTENPTRPLTQKEKSLANWMLENGKPEAKAFLEQLQNAEATNWICECGCASFNFKVKGFPEAPPGVNILGDFFYRIEEDSAGIFIYESEGILSGVEVYGNGMTTEAHFVLPEIENLSSF